MTATLRVGRVRLDDLRFHPHNVRRDLGDLRSLADSIQRYGVMQPVVAEENGDTLRLRAGHRRVAAARLAGLERVPAVIHPEPLDDDEWLMAALHENTFRRGLDADERRMTLQRLRDLGCTWQGLADSLGVTVKTVQAWTAGPGATRQKKRSSIRNSTLQSFVAQWREQDDATSTQVLDALDQLLAANRLTSVPQPAPAPAPDESSVSHLSRSDVVDEVAIQRACGGDSSVTLTVLEREEAVRRLHGQGHCDGPIAHLIGASERTVLRIRQRLELPANAQQARSA